MKKKNMILIILILSISIGFAVLSSTISIGSNIGIADASFDVHFDNVEKIDSSIENDTYSYSDSNTTLNFNITLDKPGDYVDYKVYVVNAGTIDAYLDSITINIPQAAQNYITYTLTYNNGTNLTTGDLLKKGTDKPLKLHIEYKYDVNNFISLENTTITAVLSYKQPSQKGENVWEFDYQEAEQTFTVPKTGTYRLEVWGAQGGSVNVCGRTETGGYGGYSAGNIQLTKNDKLYINVGQQGLDGNLSFTSAEQEVYYTERSYNGGSNGSSNGNCKWSGGGGATHIALVSGLLNTLENQKGTLVDDLYYSSQNIIIVAGGGGGSGACCNNIRKGGSGGGYIGTTGSNLNLVNNTETTGSCGDGGFGGTQIGSGPEGYGQASRLGSFGYGGGHRGSGGGAGFFGGNGSWNCGSPAGGGSGYIGNPNLTSKTMYCYNCQESTEETSETHIKTRSTTNVSETPTSSYAKIGSGYARISYIEN